MMNPLVKDLVRVCVAAALGTCAAFCVAMLVVTQEPPPVRRAAATAPVIEPTMQVHVF